MFETASTITEKIINMEKEEKFVPARTMLVEDHPIFRVGIRAVLEQTPAISLIDEAGTGEEAVGKTDEKSLDIIIMDINIPIIDGIQATKIIKGRHPEIKILIFSAIEEPETVISAIKAGADGYIFKTDNPNELLNAIEKVMGGENYLSQRISNKLIPHLIGKKHESGEECEKKCEELTGREHEILSFVLEGKTSKEVSKILFLSVRTVETHRYNMMKKIGCSSTAEIFKYAIDNKLI